MNYYKIKYWNGKVKIVSGNSAKEVIKKYDLASFYHRNSHVSQLSGEQLAIAQANTQ